MSLIFILDAKIDIMTCGILCPFINTPLQKRLDGDNRLFRTNFPEDWIYYTSHHLTYVLSKLTLQEFIDGIEYVYNNIYSTEVIRKKFRAAKDEMNNLNAAMFAFRVNLDWQEVYKHLLENLRDLQASGDYERALERYEALRNQKKPGYGKYEDLGYCLRLFLKNIRPKNRSPLPGQTAPRTLLPFY